MPAPVAALAGKVAAVSALATKYKNIAALGQVAATALNAIQNFRKSLEQAESSQNTTSSNDKQENILHTLKNLVAEIKDKGLRNIAPERIAESLYQGVSEFLSKSGDEIHDAVVMSAKHLAREGNRPWHVVTGLEVVKDHDPQWIAQTLNAMRAKSSPDEYWRIKMFESFAQNAAEQAAVSPSKPSYADVAKTAATVVMKSLEAGQPPSQAFKNGLVAFGLENAKFGQGLIRTIVASEAKAPALVVATDRVVIPQISVSSPAYQSATQDSHHMA